MTIRALILLGLITDKMLHEALGAEDAKLVEVLERKGVLIRQDMLTTPWPAVQRLLATQRVQTCSPFPPAFT
jgi:hypothetical protein